MKMFLHSKLDTAEHSHKSSDSYRSASFGANSAVVATRFVATVAALSTVAELRNCCPHVAVHTGNLVAVLQSFVVVAVAAVATFLDSDNCRLRHCLQTIGNCCCHFDPGNYSAGPARGRRK